MTHFIPRWSEDIYFALKIQKNTGLLIFNSLKEKKLIFNFFVNRNWKNKPIAVKEPKLKPIIVRDPLVSEIWN